MHALDENPILSALEKNIARTASLLDTLQRDPASHAAIANMMRYDNVSDETSRHVAQLAEQALQNELEVILETQVEEWASHVVSEGLKADVSSSGSGIGIPAAPLGVAPVNADELIPARGGGSDARAEVGEDLTVKEREVLAYLARHPHATQAELAKSMFVSRSTVAGYTVALQDKGYLVRVGSRREGRWIVRM